MYFRSSCLLCLTLEFFSAVAAASNATQPFSTWMAASFLSKPQIKIDRHYVEAVLYEGIQKAAVVNQNPSLLSLASNAISSLVANDGTLIGWKPNDYSLDDIRIGNNILYFWDAEGRKEDRYEKAATALRKQLDRFPRNPEGGFWHRAPQYPNQMWLDGLYMAETFYATYTSYFEPDNATAWNDIALQFDLVEAHCRNKTSGLLVHGYDEAKKAIWADPVTGASPHVWDRAVGWYYMALVEVLQVYPTNLPGYARLKSYLNALAAALKRAQDVSGGWWLVMDEPYPGMKGNYIESSATAMFTYAYLKAARTSLLQESYKDIAMKAYNLLLNRFVKHEANGTLSWEGTVEVGSLDKDASYEYYISVPLSENDGKGAGPFMFASTEVEMLQKSRARLP